MSHVVPRSPVQIDKKKKKKTTFQIGKTEIQTNLNQLHKNVSLDNDKKQRIGDLFNKISSQAII